MARFSLKRKKNKGKKILTAVLLSVIVFCGLATLLIVTGKLDGILGYDSKNKDKIDKDEDLDDSDLNTPDVSFEYVLLQNALEAVITIRSDSSLETDGLIALSAGFILESDRELSESIVKSSLRVTPLTDFSVSSTDNKTFYIKPMKALDRGVIYCLSFNPEGGNDSLSWAFQTRDMQSDRGNPADSIQADTGEYEITVRPALRAVIIGDNLKIEAESAYAGGARIPYQNLTANNDSYNSTLLTNEIGRADYSFSTSFLRNRLDNLQYAIGTVKVSPAALNKSDYYGEGFFCAFASSLYLCDYGYSFDAENNRFNINGRVFNLDLTAVNDGADFVRENFLGSPRAGQRVSASLVKVTETASGDYKRSNALTANLNSDADGCFEYGAVFADDAAYYELTFSASDSRGRKTSQILRIYHYGIEDDFKGVNSSPPLPEYIAERDFYIEVAYGAVCVEGDSPIITLRSYGKSVEKNAEVIYTVVLTSPDGSDSEYTVKSRAFTAAELELSISYGEYSLSVTAVCGDYSTEFKGKINAVRAVPERRVATVTSLSDYSSFEGEATLAVIPSGDIEIIESLIESVLEESEMVYELWKSAVKGEPVLGRINQYLKNGTIPLEQKILLTLALAELGAEAQALQVYHQISEDDLTSPEILRILENKFQSLYGGHNSEQIVITEQYKPLAEVLDGLSVRRSYSQLARGTTTDLSKKSLTTITINITRNTNAPEGVYIITDVLPAGMRFGYFDGPDSIECQVRGREVIFTVDSSVMPSRITYTARVVSGGKYFAPPTIIRHSVLDGVGAVGTGANISLS